MIPAPIPPSRPRCVHCGRAVVETHWTFEGGDFSIWLHDEPVTIDGHDYHDRCFASVPDLKAAVVGHPKPPPTPVFPAGFDVVHRGCGGVAFRYARQPRGGEPMEAHMVVRPAGVRAGDVIRCMSCGDSVFGADLIWT